MKMSNINANKFYTFVGFSVPFLILFLLFLPVYFFQLAVTDQVLIENNTNFKLKVSSRGYEHTKSFSDYLLHGFAKTSIMLNKGESKNLNRNIFLFTLFH